MAVNWSYPFNTGASLNSKRKVWLLANPTLDTGTTFYDLCARNNGTLGNFGSSGGFQSTTRTGGFSEVRWDSTSQAAGAKVTINSSVPSGNSDFDFKPAIGYSVFCGVKTTKDGVDFIQFQSTSGNGLIYLECGNTTAGGTAHKFVVYLRADDNTAAIPINSTVTIDDGNWHHVGIVLNGTTYQLYIDGTADASAAWTKAITISGGGSAVIGGVLGGPVGAMDDITVFQRALSASDVTSLYGEWAASYANTLNFGTRAKAQYFIDSVGGNDANAGTSSGAAWQTIGKVNGLLQFAGDTYSFNGVSISGNLHIQGVVPNLPALTPTLTINGYGAGTPTISCGTSYGIFLDNVYPCPVTINGFLVNGAGVSYDSGNATATTTSTKAGILVENDDTQLITQGLTINNLTVSGCLNGIQLLATNFGGFGNCTISSCKASGNGSFGIWVAPTLDVTHTFTQGTSYGQFTNINVLNCESALTYGITSVDNNGYGIVLTGCDSSNVQNTVAHDNGQANQSGASGGPVGMMLLMCRNSTLKNCEVYNQYDPSGSDGDGFDFDVGTHGCAAYGCYVHGTIKGRALTFFSSSAYGVGISAGNNTYYNCVVQVASTAGNHVSNKGANQFSGANNVIDCTIRGTAGNILVQNFGNGQLNVINCILSSAGGADILDLYSAQGDLAISNLYDTTQTSTFAVRNVTTSTTYNSLASLQAAHVNGFEYLTSTGLGYGLATTALLTNAGGGGVQLPNNSVGKLTAYDPLSNSPAYGNGVNSSSLLSISVATTDFHGNPQPRIVNGTSVYDIGAVVFPPPPPSPPPPPPPASPPPPPQPSCGQVCTQAVSKNAKGGFTYSPQCDCVGASI